MKNIGKVFKQIYLEEKIMLVLMILNLLGSLALFIFSLVTLNPSTAVVKIGYGDIGGYRNGSWSDMFAFPILAFIFGIVHNFIAVRIYNKRGAGMTKFFLITTSVLIIGTFIVLLRLLEKV